MSVYNSPQIYGHSVDLLFKLECPSFAINRFIHKAVNTMSTPIGVEGRGVDRVVGNSSCKMKMAE